jgi:hypothetical protein
MGTAGSWRINVIFKEFELELEFEFEYELF